MQSLTNMQSIPSMKTQSGAVLAACLIILLVLTVVVMSANSNVVMQERMTSAIRETNMVFQAAESALIEAEKYIDTLDAADLAGFNADGIGGLYSEGDGPGDYLNDAIWDTTANKLRGAEDTLDNYQAWYFIERLGQVNMVEISKDISLENDYSAEHESPLANVFRVVVRAVGPNGVSEQIIAGYYSAEAF